MSAPLHCRHCGAEVAARASFCRECGSDAATGWSEEAENGGLDLPQPFSDREYQDFVAREWGEGAGRRRPSWGALVAAALVALLLLEIVF